MAHHGHHGTAADPRAFEEMAAAIERDMGRMAQCWEEVAAGDRGVLLARLERSAPQVVRLLCPAYGRFRPH